MKQTLKRQRAFTILLISLIVAGGLGLGAYSKGSWSFLCCRLLFDYYLSQDSKELDAESRSGLSSTYYFTSYYLNGMLSAVEGTRDERLLRKTLRYLDTMVSKAEDFDDHGHRYQAWRPFAVTPDTLAPEPNLHFTFQATVPLARAAAIIMTNPGFRDSYAPTAHRYIAFIDQMIVQYWFKSRLNGEIPWINLDHFPIWNDNGSNLALILTFLYRATGNSMYQDMARQIGEAFKAKLIPVGNGWIWESQTIPIGSDTDNTPGSVGNQAGVPDTSHTNRESMLMVSQYEAGLVFNEEDLKRMAHTFTDFIWNQSPESPMFSNYINGSDLPYRVYKKPGLNGSIYHGWALIGGYSEEAQQVLLWTLRAIALRHMNPALERNTTSYGGRLALCGHILRNFALVGIQPADAGKPSLFNGLKIIPLSNPPTGLPAVSPKQ